MKIGDKVRYLNAVGGGIVKSFKNKDIVWVEEEDGFETPALLRECIVVEADNKKPVKVNNNTFTADSVFVNDVDVKVIAGQARNDKNIQACNDNSVKEEKYEIVELPGKEKLNIFLAYLPLDIKMIGKCPYEVFLINDSNYYLFFNYMNRQNNAWNSRFTGIIEPNTRLFIEEFTKDQLNDLEKICIQFIAFKKDKPYSLKNAYSIELRIDGVKFYKLHCFRENDFFEDDALIYPVVVNDVAERELLISASDLQEVMTQKVKAESSYRRPAPIKKERIQPIIEVDLHINQLLDSSAGMSNTEIITVQLAKFNKTLEENKNKKGQKIVFIHGKGEGVLRNAILSELKLKYKSFTVQDASFKEYGFGATMVTIR